MKLIHLYSFILCTLMATSCKNDSPKEPFENKGLVGKWKLVEALNDRGGGGEYHKVIEEQSSVLEFGADGSFKETKGIIYSSINPYNSYKMLDSTHIQFEVKDASQPFAPMHWSIMNLTSTTLELRYNCFEMCSGKYIAIK